MMYCDCHLHSSFSSDSDTPMELMIREAIRLQVPSMCFTEHMDLDFPPGGLPFVVDLPAYEKTFQELKEKYGAQIELLFGLELGLQPHLKEEIPALADSMDFDFLIGSTHVIFISRDAQNMKAITGILRFSWRISRLFPVSTAAGIWIM